jgi:single-stranded DNA-binding protein
MKTHTPASQAVSFIGRVTKDATTNAERQVTNVDTIVTAGYMKDGAWVEIKQYFRIAAWGEYPSQRAALLKKGDMVQITIDPARIVTRIWGDNNDKVSLEVPGRLTCIVCMNETNGRPEPTEASMEDDMGLGDAEIPL